MSKTVAAQFGRVARFNQALLAMQRISFQSGRQTGKTHTYLLALRNLAMIASEIDPQYYQYLWVNPYELHKLLDAKGIPAPRLRGDFLLDLDKKAA